MKEYKINEQCNKRIDKYVSELNVGAHDCTLTRIAVQRMISEGNILLNGNKVKPSYILGKDDVITIEKEIPIESDIKPQDIPLDIVYEDDDILVVNKEKGMVVHPREWK